MAFIDLTHPLTSSTQIYPSDPTFYSSPHATHEKDGYAVQKLSLGTHTGTHIDAPFHFVQDGKTVETLALGKLVGKVLVIDLSKDQLKARERITWACIEPHLNKAALPIEPDTIVLINTGWSKLYYQTPVYLSHPYLAPEVAHELLRRGVSVIGVDTLNPDETPVDGIEEGPDGFGFHSAFLGAGGVIAENLTNLEELMDALSEEEGGRYWIVSLVPLKLVGADGSPVRAFAYLL